MNREQILALLKSLGVVIGDGEGQIKEDDAVKLVEDSFKAENLGLIQNRDKLLANEVKLKESMKALEAKAGESDKRIIELDAQLKKANPQEYKDYYEGQAKTLQTQHETALKAIEAERDKYRDSHYARLRDDAINQGTKGFEFVDGLKDGFIALAMTRNQFKPVEVDGKTIFTNQDNETMEAVFHKLKMTDEGKAYLKNLNAGAGTGNSPGVRGGSSPASGQTISREQFNTFNAQQKQEYISKGGLVASPNK